MRQIALQSFAVKVHSILIDSHCKRTNSIAKFCSEGPSYSDRQSLQKDTNGIAKFCSEGPSYSDRQSLQKDTNKIAKFCSKGPSYCDCSQPSLRAVKIRAIFGHVTSLFN